MGFKSKFEDETATPPLPLKKVGFDGIMVSKVSLLGITICKILDHLISTQTIH